MARPKRKRDVVAADEPVPTPRRRRSQAGYEPTNLIQNDAKATPDSVKSKTSLDTDTLVTSKSTKTSLKENKSSRDDTAADEGISSPPNEATETLQADVGDDHAESEEKKTTSQDEAVMTLESPPATREVLNIPASAVLSSNDTAQVSDKSLQQTKRVSKTINSEGGTNETKPVNSNPAVNDEATLRNDRIRAALKHRRILLTRVQQGRSATQQRVQILDLAHPESKGMTDEQESLSYQEMVRTVNVAVRKQARSEASNSAAAASTQERAVSLRRSSGVAKRMNTALTSTTGGVDQNTISVLEQLDSSDMTNVDIPSSATVTVPEKVKNTVPSNGTIQKAASRPASATGHSSQRKGLDALGAGMKQKNHSAVAGAQQSSSTTNGGVVRKNLNKHFPMIPRVVCPETSTLRERRDEIRIHLAKMLQDRHHRSQISSSSSYLDTSPNKLHERRSSSLSVTSLPSVGRSLNRDSASVAHDRPGITSHSHIPLWQGPDGPPKLPQRRRTHWDTVLEEMRWMATDFMEERKWKASTTRLLAMQVVNATGGHTLPESTTGNETIVEESTNEANVMDYSESKLSPFEDAVVESISNDHEDIESSETNMPEGNTSTRQFNEIAEEEKAASQTVAKDLSRFILNFVTSERKTLMSDVVVLETDDTNDPDSTLLFDDAHNSTESVVTRDDKSKLVERASKYVDTVMEAIQHCPDIPTKSALWKTTNSTASTHGFQLTAEQATAVSSVEDNWNRVRAGAVLHGPVASGKTISACSLLWRQRELGPQLLVCSSGSIIRWLHELGRLGDVNLKALNKNTLSYPDGSKQTASLENFTGRDIVVCRYSALLSMDTSYLSRFRSIAIDCRFPSGCAGSKRSRGLCTAGDSLAAHTLPKELISVTWWSKLATIIAANEVNRLLIDTLHTDALLSHLRSLSNRHFLEVISLRTSFLLGSQPFVTSGLSIEKAILTWSRQRSKTADATGSKFQNVKVLLSSLMTSFYCSVAGVTALEDRKFSSPGILQWEMRRCKMTSNQSELYDRACRQYSSVLSKPIDVANPDACNVVADALLTLRRHCTHPNIGETLRAMKMRRAFGNSKTIHWVSAPASSASQSNVEWARYTLIESCKLCHLASILVYECGCKFAADPIVESLLADNIRKISGDTSRDTKEAMKIVILASLPEIQMVVSTLLHSLGIDHELLTSTSASVMNHRASKELAWFQSQLTLSKFSRSKSGVDILIASPVTVASGHGGLGIDDADLILSVDEDWSGQGEMIVRELVSRCYARKQADGSGGLRFVRLVTENTCEEKFLSVDLSTQSSNGTSSKLKTCAVSVDGPSSKTELVHKTSIDGHLFLFPCCNLLARRREYLCDVLCSVNLCPQLMQLALPTDLTFLPYGDGEEHLEGELMMLRILMEKERKMSLSYQCGYGCSLLSASQLLPSQLLADSTINVESLDFPASLRRHNLSRLIDDRSGPDVNRGVLVLRDDPSSIATRLENETIPVSSLERDAALSSATVIPTDCVASLLFYSLASKKRELSGQASCSGTGTAVPSRANFFTALYGGRHVESIHDGNQGSEALVYFPPIFPRMQECAATATSDIYSLRSSAMRSGTLPPYDGVSRVITEDEASHSDAASVLMDLFDDYGLAGIGAFPFPRDSALTASNLVHTKDPSSNLGDSSEWYSSVPLCDAEEFHISKQAEHHGLNPGSVILFVSRKRPRGSADPLGNSQLSRNMPHTWSGDSSNSTFIRDFNGSLKKAKKPPNVSAFNRIQTSDLVSRSDELNIPRKDDYRNRLLTTLRRSSTGTTLYEAPMFQAAAVRVRKKVSHRLLCHVWNSGVSFDAGPGLPLLVSKQKSSSGDSYAKFEADPRVWTSIVKRLQNKNSVTGGEAIELSQTQRMTLKRSLVAPCRVDFGPFQCGFLSSPSGTTVANPPKSRIGVTLPMGVKITSSTRELDPLQWTGQDDTKLQGSVVRFGLNWRLAARVVSGLHDLMHFSQTESKNRLPQRAGRSCRDRWQLLVRSNPSLIVKAMPSERSSLRVNVAKFNESGHRAYMVKGTDEKLPIIGKSPKTVLLVPPFDHYGTHIEVDAVRQEAAVESTVPRLKSRRKFAAFQRARVLRRSVPISIPGVPLGSAPESHPSHDQAVQKSVSAAWNGRPTDMWPLQLLEAADKQRLREIEAPQATVATNSLTASRQAPASSARPANNAVLPSSRNQEASAPSQIRATVAPVAATVTVPTVRSAASHSARPAVPPARQVPKVVSVAAKQSFVPPVSMPSVPPSTTAKERPVATPAKALPPPVAKTASTVAPAAPPSSAKVIAATPKNIVATVTKTHFATPGSVAAPAGSKSDVATSAVHTTKSNAVATTSSAQVAAKSIIPITPIAPPYSVKGTVATSMPLPAKESPVSTTKSPAASAASAPRPSTAKATASTATLAAPSVKNAATAATKTHATGTGEIVGVGEGAPTKTDVVTALPTGPPSVSKATSTKVASPLLIKSNATSVAPPSASKGKVDAPVPMEQAPTKI